MCVCVSIKMHNLNANRMLSKHPINVLIEYSYLLCGLKKNLYLISFLCPNIMALT